MPSSNMSYLLKKTSDDQDRIESLEVIFDEGTSQERKLQTNELLKNRVKTPEFDLDFPDNNIFDCPKGITRAVSDGYWVFLKNLPGPKHTIKFHGKEDDFDIELMYNVTII
jgi:hypothetical protein